MEVVLNKTFRNETIPLDGHDYRGCTFAHVTFRYGGGVCVITRCSFEGAPSIEVINPLARGLHLLGMLSKYQSDPRAFLSRIVDTVIQDAVPDGGLG